MLAQNGHLERAYDLRITPGVCWHGQWVPGRIERNRRIYDYELVLFSRGHGRVISADEVYYNCAGTVMILPPDWIHCTIAESEVERWCVHFDWMGDCSGHRDRSSPFVYLDAPEPFDRRQCAAPPPEELGIVLPFLRRLSTGEADRLLELLQRYFTSSSTDLPGWFRRQSLLLEILALTLSEPHAGNEATQAKRGNARFFQAKGIFDARFTESELRVGTVADQLLITPNHLSKLFRQEVGMSAQDYLQNRRLELARRLLISSQLTVAEVAHDAGFESPNYFARFFRRRLGLSPSEFRLHKTVEKQES